ncbi:hypothetical protein [Acrocarpospora catenulata]|uniref:hypothetical protein n=1 Tax=Acrocarpospora catenulata TaxID=2836182 RepID=UPI001BDB5BE7|nr:hypothetical protein [Acrocarpospora catenulata]
MDAYALLLLPLAGALLPRVVAVIALALVLRGSTPSERPALLDAVARCLRSMPRGWPSRAGGRGKAAPIRERA